MYQSRQTTLLGPISYLTDDIGRESTEFRQRHHDELFFLYASFNAPHTPMQGTEEDLRFYSHMKNKDVAPIKTSHLLRIGSPLSGAEIHWRADRPKQVGIRIHDVEPLPGTATFDLPR